MRASVHRISEATWRTAAAQHSQRIRELLLPGLLAEEDTVQFKQQRSKRRRRRKRGDNNNNNWAPLDPKHPVYNFLIEYYGLKGTKGPRRLARWSPHFSSSHQSLGVLLENATPDDMYTLHLRGATWHPEGILYHPRHLFSNHVDKCSTNNDRQTESKPAKTLAMAATPFLWYRSILKQTASANPILHCYGLHEWAMQYQPTPDAPVPPSAKYQSHLPLRCSRAVIAATVERKGIHCTHVDALRFFAPAAAPLNHHGASLERTDQLRLEQPACVHAHMDLLKICLRLTPFCDAQLLHRVLEVALEARRLDVAASPYDASAYNVTVVPVETTAGRAEYRAAQQQLMKKTEPIRRELLRAYETFLELAFDNDTLVEAENNPGVDRFARAAPGDKPWRQNLIEQV